MLRVGITGGIGSGKTTVARILAEKGFPVYIADREAARLMRSDPFIREHLCRLFGADIYTPDGEPDKKRLAGIIFRNREALAQVNALVHPEVIRDFEQWSRKQPGEIVFFETALLYEAGLSHHFDRIVMVYASPETRIKRVMARDGLSEEQVRERMANQGNSEEHCRKADFVIYTENGEDLCRQIENMLEKIAE
ncbi:MAG: dephospho-CoA kinase [Culturomica sp.]|jgi:dephospho-CoA kinase|nr:dephospho-CoA kinase [Culturomica sp.]